ncbi:MAG: sulfatase [Gemmataceae bacterium]
MPHLRPFWRWSHPLLGLFAVILGLWSCPDAKAEKTKKKPNILFVISDDQSYPHCSAYGCQFVKTPGFDRVAKEGILFNNAYAASCGCSPSRASLLTGRHPWQNKQAGTHASSFPKELAVYPSLLERVGYFVGYTGKPWGPGNWKASGRKRNPAGNGYNSKRNATPAAGISRNDYAGNFKVFLSKKPKDQPFCFWVGGSEPHRSYQKGIGLKMGKKLKDVDVPPFLPDTKEIRSDMLDYAVEIEWFDSHLVKILRILEQAGELDNTIIIVTGDNGMPFPRAKANLYDYGTHVPLAIRWGDRVKGKRIVDDLVGFVDFAPTYLEVAGLEPHKQMAGKSLLPILLSKKSGQVDHKRNRVFTSRERHSSSRVKNWTYPCRAIRKGKYLYIRNFKPNRWPAGDPRGVGRAPFGYYDIDGSPSKTFLVQNKKKYRKYFDLAVAKRPEHELFDLETDPGNLKNLATKTKYEQVFRELRTELERYLQQTRDPRVLGKGDVWESYRRYSPIRKFE